MTDVVWLASYPKSGSTWFRILLENLWRAPGRPVRIDELSSTFSGGIDRQAFDDAMQIDSSDLTADELYALKRQYLTRMTRVLPSGAVVKIHDANVRLLDGRALVAPEATRCALYLVRNPLDIVPSFADHFEYSVDEAIDRLADRGHRMVSSRFSISTVLEPRLGSWSEHVVSWLDAPDLWVHCVRYEDLSAEPVDTLRAALDAAGLDYEPARLQEAVAFSRFEELARQEREHGFAHKPRRMRRFFNRGRVGAWRGLLSPEQQARIVEDNEDVMFRLGYIDASRSPLL